MLFSDFMRMSEARFNLGQIKRHNLNAPTTLRREIGGWEVWFRDVISELPDETRRKRRLLHSLSDDKLDARILAYIKGSLEDSLSRGAKGAIKKFQKASVFRNSSVSNQAIYSPDKTATSLWGKFSKAAKSLNQKDPRIEPLAAKMAVRLIPLLTNKQALEKASQSAIAIMSRELLGTSIDPSHFLPQIGNMEGHINWRLQREPQADPRVIAAEEIKEELIASMTRMLDMFNAYHVQLKDKETQEILSTVKTTLHLAIEEILYSLGDKELAGRLLRGIDNKVYEELSNDSDSVVKFIGDVRNSRKNIDLDTTMDGLAYYIASRAIKAIKSFAQDELRAGKDTDDYEFEQWMGLAAANFNKVINSLHALGIRKFVRIPVVFNYQDWNERWNGVGIGGLHYLGDKRKAKETDPDTGSPKRIGADKHDHRIELYSTNPSTIAHEIGHAVYYLLPREQQEEVRWLANQGPLPSNYASPSYVYSGSDSPSYSHQSGNEWFAEMLALVTKHPELLNSRIEVGDDESNFVAGNKPLPIPDKPRYDGKFGYVKTARDAQIKDLTGMVRKFKRVFASQQDDFRGYKRER